MGKLRTTEKQWRSQMASLGLLWVNPSGCVSYGKKIISHFDWFGGFHWPSQLGSLGLVKMMMDDRRTNFHIPFPHFWRGIGSNTKRSEVLRRNEAGGLGCSWDGWRLITRKLPWPMSSPNSLFQRSVINRGTKTPVLIFFWEGIPPLRGSKQICTSLLPGGEGN